MNISHMLKIFIAISVFWAVFAIESNSQHVIDFNVSISSEMQSDAFSPDLQSVLALGYSNKVLRVTLQENIAKHKILKPARDFAQDFLTFVSKALLNIYDNAFLPLHLLVLRQNLMTCFQQFFVFPENFNIGFHHILHQRFQIMCGLPS